MYINNETFLIDDFKAGQIIKLTINKNTYLLLSNDVLVNLKTGQIAKKIEYLIDFVKTVYSNDEEQLAIRIGNKLYHYNPFIHNDELARIKRNNKLLTAQEIERLLAKDNLMLNLDTMMYKKTTAVKIMLDKGILKTCECVYAQKILPKRAINYKTYNDTKMVYDSSRIVKLNCMVERITIDKNEKLYLYRYQLAPYLF